MCVCVCARARARVCMRVHECLQARARVCICMCMYLREGVVNMIIDLFHAELCFCLIILSSAGRV